MSRTFRGRLLVCAVAITVVAASALGAGTALAAKGGGTTGGTTKTGHGGHTSGGSLPGTCSVTPNPATFDGPYTVKGSGFHANEPLNVEVSNQGMQVLMTVTDASGNFAVGSYAGYTGTYTVLVFDNTGGSMTYISGCSFQVN